MSRLLTIVVFFFLNTIGYSQNLIPNPSFEDTLRKRTPNYALRNWTSPNLGSPDYLTPFNDSTRTFPRTAPSNYLGYQTAKEGKAYVGLRINSDSMYDMILREYVQVKLKRQLIKDSTYCFQIFVSLADSMHYASKDQLGVYFSRSAVTTTSVEAMPYIPQLIVSPNNYIDDKTNWMQFDLSYTANGRKDYITIGNFKDSSSVDTLNVGGGGNKLEYYGTYYYIDNLYLGDCDSVPKQSTRLINLEKAAQPRIYPNPTNGTLQITSEEALKELMVFDVQGRLVQRKQLFSKGDQALSIEGKPGLYFLQIWTQKGNRYTEKVIKR